MKPGTRVEVGLGLGHVETGVVMRWSKVMGRREDVPEGYHPIRFDADGARLMLHCGKGVRVIENLLEVRAGIQELRPGG